MFCGAAKTMDRMATSLAQINLVKVGLKNRSFAKTTLQGHGHDRFVEFSPQASLRGQEQVFDQLLGDRRPTLNYGASTQISPCRARKAARVNPKMMGKLPVLDSLNTGNEQRRKILQGNQRAVTVI